MLNGFIDSQHQAKFEAARVEHQRGGALAKCCGARTRSGAACRMVPLSGQNRCLRHAGPAGARRYREQQIRDLALGRLDPEAFAEAERRRAVNRLRWTWKKDPWFPGITLDLGLHETAFRGALAAFGWRAEHLPPAVADWARWRFRRLMVDRQHPGKWADLAGELRERIRAAGAPPDEPQDVAGMGAIFSTPDRLGPYSRRRAVDPKRQAQTGTKAQNDKALLKIPTNDAEVLGAFLNKHRADLAPVLARYPGEAERLTVAAAFKQLLESPGSSAAQRAWIDTLRRLED